MTSKSYSAPWGRKIWLITGATSLIGIGSAVVLPFVIPIRHPDDRWAIWIAPIIVMLIVVGTSFWRIRRFELTDNQLLVHRVLWSNPIELAQIKSAEFDPVACKGAWKTMGNDGLFAMHGRFHSKHLGKFQAYVTDPVNSVVLKLPTDTVVVSPENPRSFVRELNHRIERLKKEDH